MIYVGLELHINQIPVEAILMCAKLGYQFLLSDSALSCVVKAALENAYPKIGGRMPVTTYL